MPRTAPAVPDPTDRILVNLRPTGALRAADLGSRLHPLYPPRDPFRGVLGLDADPQWNLAELPDGAAHPWELAHGRVAEQLGVAGGEARFAEPEIMHDIYLEANPGRTLRGPPRDRGGCALKLTGNHHDPPH